MRWDKLGSETLLESRSPCHYPNSLTSALGYRSPTWLSKAENPIEWRNRSTRSPKIINGVIQSIIIIHVGKHLSANRNFWMHLRPRFTRRDTFLDHHRQSEYLRIKGFSNSLGINRISNTAPRTTTNWWSALTRSPQELVNKKNMKKQSARPPRNP